MERTTTRTGASGAPGGQNRPRKGKKRNRFSRPLKLSRLVFAALIVALSVVIILTLVNKKPVDTDIEALKDDGTFLTGIKVNGIDVSGMGYYEARSAILPGVQSALEKINVTVVHSTTLWVLTAADMGARSTLDAVLTEAIALGRSGSVVENSNEREDVEQNGREFLVTFVPDEAKLKEKLAAIGVAVDTKPVEPSAVAVTTSLTPEFEFREGSDGYMLDEQALYDEIAAILASGEPTATLTPELHFVAPDMSIDDVKAQTQLISTFQTSFGGSRAARNEKRVGNIQRACTMLNGMSVPNETEFNFNGYIGPRTEAGGWPLAPGIVNGNQYEDQAGGGICQVSTTMYNALLCAGASMQRGSTLEEVLTASIPGISVTERRHHTWPSSYVDTGLDSTVTGTVESGKSLNFVNNTGATIYVFVYCDNVNYTVTIYVYGIPLPDGVTYQVRGVVDEVLTAETVTVYDTSLPADYKEVTIKARDGYKATAYRDTYINGEFQSTETLYQETYNPVTGETTLGTGGAPAPSTTPGA